MAALLLLAPAPALAEPAAAGAERALDTYRRTFAPVAEIDCPRGDGGEIVVCARRRQTERVQPDGRSEPGNRAIGDTATSAAALKADECMRLCY